VTVSTEAAPRRVTTGARVREGVSFAWRAVGQGAVDFYNSNNLTYAASIAYYTLLSLFPFMLLLLTIFSRMVIGMNEETLVQIVMRALPGHFDFVIDQIGELSKARPARGVIGTILMIWASMGVFSAIWSAVNNAWGVERPPGYFKQKLIAFAMLLVAGLLMVAALSINGLVEIVEARWFATAMLRLPSLTVLTGVSTFAYRHAPTPLFILIVGLVYYFVPSAQVRLRDVLPGAIVAGLLWRAAFVGFSLYLRHWSRFNVNGSIAAVVVFLVWVYISSVVLLYGAQISAAHARLRKHLPKDAPAAAART
jgi:membrane protein